MEGEVATRGSVENFVQSFIRKTGMEETIWEF
jgi:hypothetical protein